MSAKHTPPRLTVTHNSWGTSTIYCEGREVALVRMDSEAHEDDEQHCENARRLAACWNACEGLPTEILESIAMMGDTLASRFRLRDQVERDLAEERDELLALLQAFPGFTDDATAGDAWLEKMRAAITKAIG